MMGCAQLVLVLLLATCESSRAARIAHHAGVLQSALESALVANTNQTLSELTTDQIQELITKDRRFLLKVQKDLLQIVTARARMPSEVYSKAFSHLDASSSTGIEAFTGASLNIVGVSGVSDVGAFVISTWQNARLANTLRKTGRDVKRGKAEEQESNLLMASKANFVATDARLVTLSYANDVNYFHMARTYTSVKRGVDNMFRAHGHEWYKFKGKRPVPIYKNMNSEEEKVGEILRLEEFIIEEFVGKASDTSRELYGRLGDGRGWVRTDLSSMMGGIALDYFKPETVKFTAEEKKKKCEEAKAMLTANDAKGSDGLDMFRHVTSKGKKVVHNTVVQSTAGLAGLFMVGLGIAFPPSLPVVAVAVPALGLTNEGLKAATMTGFETMLQPILFFMLVQLANFELSTFSPELRSKADKSECSLSLEQDLLQQLSSVSDAEKATSLTRCDIVKNKCADGQFCMRRGVFTHTAEEHPQEGYCVDVDWPQVPNGQFCGLDQDCFSGVCNLDVDLPDEDFKALRGTKFWTLAESLGVQHSGGLATLNPAVKRLLGVCVEPCDLADLESTTCSNIAEGYEYGFITGSDHRVD